MVYFITSNQLTDELEADQIDLPARRMTLYEAWQLVRQQLSPELCLVVVSVTPSGTTQTEALVSKTDLATYGERVPDRSTHFLAGGKVTHLLSRNGNPPECRKCRNYKLTGLGFSPGENQLIQCQACGYTDVMLAFFEQG